MSQFTDDMIDDGFDDPSDYLDYLCAQSDLAERREEEYRDEADYYDQPSYVRRLLEPTCPYCNNEIKIASDHEVICRAFPVCSFRKEINNSDFYFNYEIKSFYDRRDKDHLLRLEINHNSNCPKCGNSLKEYKSNFGDYQKCSGFPACNFMAYLESNNNY